MAEKRGEKPGFEGNEYTELASALELPVLKAAEKRFGWQIANNVNRLWVDHHCTRHAATPDGLMRSPWGLAVVQVKWSTCVAMEDVKPVTKKGNPSTAAYLNGPPLDYQLQVQSEIACVDACGGVLLVMHTAAPTGLKLRPYYVARHEGVIAKIRREVARFWAEMEG